MVRCVGNASGHDPGARTLHVKESGLTFEPSLIFSFERRQSPGAEVGITLHETQPRLRRRQRRFTYVNTKHISEPQVLADALMHHLLMHAAPASGARLRAGPPVCIV